MATIIVGPLDVLTTDMPTPFFTANNTYVFSNDHDLIGEVLEFPEGIILKFEGGTLNGGTLKGNGTVIETPQTMIFGKTLKIDETGTWNIDRAYSDWFDCYKDGYYIDPTTFSIANQTYNYGSTTGISMGTASGATGHNDRYILQQLLNLSAGHTIISDGIYMVDSLGGNSSNPYYQLTWANKKGLTLQIDGILKLIPNNLARYAILAVADCEQVNLCGAGKLVGDLPEHTDTGGEWGMCLMIINTADLTLKQLTFEQAWGDGVYYYWNTSPHLASNNKQLRHFWQGVKCQYSRRTGFAAETGDDVTITGSTFTYNGFWRHQNIVGMFSGVDIEPFEQDEFYKRYCSNFTFRDCIFTYNFNAGLRGERCVGLLIDGNRFEHNNKDIELLACDFGNYDVTPNVHTERQYVGGCVNVLNNQSRNSNVFIQGSEIPSRAIIENNFLQNTNSPFNGMWIDTVFRNNKVYNSSNIMYTWIFLKNVTVESNEYHHVKMDYGADELIQMIMLPYYGEGGTTERERYSAQITNFVFKNNLIKDYSLKKLPGSGANLIYGALDNINLRTNGNPPMPYGKLREQFIRLNSNMITDRVVFKDNIMPRERFYLVRPDTGVIADSGSHFEKVHFYNKIDPKTDKLWLVGDYFYDEKYLQEAVVTTAGRTAPYAEWEVITTFPGQPVHANSIMFHPASNVGKNRPDGYGDGVSGNNLDVTGEYWISMAPPVLHWKTIGKCTSTDRPTGTSAYNSMGRILIETDNGNMIKYNSLTPGWDVL